MKRILFAAAVWLFGCAGAVAQVQGPIYCNNQVLNTSIATATTTSLIPVPSGSARTYLCGYSLVGNTGATGMTLQLEYGTGAACTNPTPLSPAIPVAAGAIFADSSTFFRGLLVPSGNGVCVVSAGTVAASVQLFFAQQ